LTTSLAADPTLRPAEPAKPSHWPAMLGYLLLTCIFTFPAVIRLGSHVAGSGDALYFVWEVWWFYHAVFELHTNPLVTPLLFYPAPATALVWSTPVNLLPGMPLVGAFGPVVAYNLLALASVALSGFTAYLLAYHLVGRRDAAFLAGAAFTLAPVHMSHVAFGQLGVMTLQWVPLCALALLRLYETPTWRRAGLFALGFALVAATDVYVAAYFLSAFALTFVAYYGLADRAHFWRPGFLGKAALAVAVGVLAVVPFHLPTFTTLHGAETTAAMAETVHRFHQDVVQFFVPPPEHRLFGFLSRPYRALFENACGYLGFTVLALSAVALRFVRGHAVRFWALFSGLTLVLSMGTYLHVAGPTPVPLPYLLFTKLPVLNALRTPSRYLELTALGLAMLVALGAAWWLPRLGNRARWGALGLLAALSVEFLVFFPFPTRTAAVPEFYRQYAHSPAAGPILEVPTGDPSWGGLTHQWMLYQTVHGKPLVYGHTHRVPDGVLAFSEKTPVVHELTRLAYTGGQLKLAPEYWHGASERLGRLGITHVGLHAWPGMLDGEGYDHLKQQLDRLFGPPVYVEPGRMAVYRMAVPPQVSAPGGR
jgi:hypothetical protein